MAPAAFDLAAVSKVYPGPAPVTAVAGVDLRVAAGERLALVGPSGSGKTTLLHLLGTLERPSSGRVSIGGEDVSRLSDRALSAVRAHRLGFVFQQFVLLEHRSVVDNVAEGLLYRGVPAAARRREAVAALARVGLADRGAHRPPQLSGGERQRVAIARAVVGRPAAVLADEPTGNLDSATGAAIVDLLRGLNDDETTIVVVTHDPGVAEAMDRQVVMGDGRIIDDRSAG